MCMVDYPQTPTIINHLSFLDTSIKAPLALTLVTSTMLSNLTAFDPIKLLRTPTIKHVAPYSAGISNL